LADFARPSCFSNPRIKVVSPNCQYWSASRVAEATRPAVQRLLDKDAIRDVIAMYARGVDRGDQGLIRSCFWDAAIDYHGFATMDPDHLAAASGSMTAVFDSTMHFLGNSIICVEGDRAHSETYCVAYHRLTAPSAEVFDRLVGFRIVDKLERRSSHWQFLERVYLFEWSRIDEVQSGWRAALDNQSATLNAVLKHWPMPAGAMYDKRDKSDPAYDDPHTTMGAR
jgi:SnoaL-like domain